MSLLTPRSVWTTIVVLVLLALSSVYAHPIRESSTSTTNIEPRDPRLIPDTEHYLADVFEILGVADPTPSQTPTPTFTPFISAKAQQGEPENIRSSPTSTTHEASFTTVIRHGDSKPIENIQIGSGWSGKKKLTAEDLPVIFDAVSKELAHRFRNMIDSSDEVGLNDGAGALGFLR